VAKCSTSECGHACQQAGCRNSGCRYGSCICVGC
uniref:Potassium channel toxin alpha-KTx 24.1 n=1 Tax=Pandinus imperator TaxID=55084 RepID=KA241_PANIM|nr:RecName: Full=Potassium channel toxin alpha-KTx 24.1; AltName: Full=Potassium channel-blocking toxin 5; Short=Pi5 [Pandinus imperator]